MMNPNKNDELKDSEKEKKDTSLSEEEMDELIREYQESLASVAEAKKRLTDRFAGKSEEEMADELTKVYSEVEEDAKKEGIPIMYVDLNKKKQK